MSEPTDRPGLSTAQDFDGPAFSPLYTTTVTVDGGAVSHGRASGRARSADGALDLTLRLPAELGGDSGGTNPEQLFAAALAACFHGALSLVARQAGRNPATIAVHATVAFGRDPRDGGYLVRADVVVTWPGTDAASAAPLLERADALCPYTKMLAQGTPATVTLGPSPQA
ncbi:Ohr family peroxiredoxin [Actinacidiphila glaucinigra]|uniref:Ohr family peroxiredoxin n=1 Tax=Actinacidiphila glaucinigra TaxID=235986 RepID=UPI002E300107|nr:Ohr family peroxiredoxin [Actinacidiphila glaucinigra]